MRTQEQSTTTYTKVIAAVNKLSVTDKDKLFRKLKSERMRLNLNKLRTSTKNFPLGFTEISKEIESVRKSRYEGKKKKQSSN